MEEGSDLGMCNLVIFSEDRAKEVIVGLGVWGLSRGGRMG